MRLLHFQDHLVNNPPRQLQLKCLRRFTQNVCQAGTVLCK